MAHHGENPLNELSGEQMMKAFKDGHLFTDAKDLQHQLSQASEHIGATNKFPDGLISGDDKGEIAFGVAIYEGKLIFNFGKKPVSWFGLTKEQATDLVDLLQKKVKEM